MKLKAATAHEGFCNTKQPEVAAGQTRGRLLVVEEVVGRRIQGSRAWRCVCLGAEGGPGCGAEVLKPTHYLTRPGIRACPKCADAHQR